MEGVFEAASAEPVQATLVLPRFFRDAFRFFREPQENPENNPVARVFRAVHLVSYACRSRNERAPNVRACAR